MEQLRLPMKEQLKLVDAVVGVLIHYNIQVFEPGYKWREQWGYKPDPKII